MMKYLFQIILLSILLSMSFQAVSKKNSMVVEYNLDGKLITVKGEKTTQGYRFNAQSKNIIHMATLNWPPYISEELCNKGWVFQYTVALLAYQGYQVNIHFYPWARSVKLVETGHMDILFPEYFIEDSAPSDTVKGKKRSELLMLSNEFPGGEVALLKRKGELFNFKGNLDMLKGELIGVVRGYQNTPEFDTMMDNKQFNVINAVDELQLMRLLYAKRVKVMVGDPKVFRFSVEHSTLPLIMKNKLLDGIEVVKPSLKYNDLYFAISNKSPKWKTIINDINVALAKFKQSGETQRFKNISSRCNN